MASLQRIILLFLALSSHFCPLPSDLCPPTSVFIIPALCPPPPVPLLYTTSIHYSIFDQTFFREKVIGCQNGYHPIKKFFQSRCCNNRYGRSDKFRAYRASYFGWLLVIWLTVGRRFFLAPITCIFFYSSTIEAHKSHKRLGMKDDGVNVQKKLESGNNTHQVYENYSHKRDFAFPLFRFVIKPHKQIFKAELVEKTKELIKKPCFAKAINFRDVFAVSKIFGYTGLISIGGVPG